MDNENNQLFIPNTQEPTKPLIAINIHNSVKLTSTNYLSWKLQIEAILIGYGLQQFIDGSLSAPPVTIPVNEAPSPNPENITWLRQDKLIFGALVGSISPNLIPLITQSRTSRDAWMILANTYARPSRGHIKQIKDQIKQATKGSQTITEYMQFIKTRTDELAMLGKPMDDEDITEKILDGLDADYKPIVDVINARDTTISFDELHEKLINKELSLRSHTSTLTPLPVSANPTSTRSNFRHHGSGNQRSWGQPPSNSNEQSDRPPPRPYLGKCQGCRTQGHTVQQCPLFRLTPMNPQSTPPSRTSRQWQPRAPSPWQPRANVAITDNSDGSNWLLDSGASHHVTTEFWTSQG